MKLSIRATTLFAALTLLGSWQAEALELKYSTHLPPPVLINKAGVIPVFDALNKASNGEITVKYFWAGQLFRATGNFLAVRDGVVDAAFTQPASNQAEMKANLLFSDLYHLGGDPYATAAAVNQTIMLDCPECKDEYSKQNAQFMGTHATTQTNLVCTSEIKSIDDIKGKKVFGLPTIAPWIQTLRATQLSVPPPRQLKALQRGVADCTIISPEWLTAFSIDEAAKTVIQVSNGSQFAISMMTMNKKSWQGLSSSNQQVLLRTIPKAIHDVISGYKAQDVKAVAAAKAKGVVFTDLGGAYQAKMDAYLNGYEKRVVEIARKRGVKNPEQIVSTFTKNLSKWKKLVTEKGTNNYSDLLWDEIYSKVRF